MDSTRDSKVAAQSLHVAPNDAFPVTTISGVGNPSFISSQSRIAPSIATASFPLPPDMSTDIPPGAHASTTIPQGTAEIFTTKLNTAVPTTISLNALRATNSNDSSGVTSTTKFHKEYEEARESVLKSIITSDNLLPPTIPSKRGPGRPKKVVEPVDSRISPQLQELVPYETGEKLPDTTVGVDTSVISTLSGDFANPGISAEGVSSSLLPLKRPRGRPRGSKNKVNGESNHVEKITTSRGGMHRGKKRKLSGTPDDEFDVDDSYPSTTPNTAAKATASADPNVTPSTFITKSGRQIHRPTQFVPLQSPTSGTSHGNSGKKRGGRSGFVVTHSNGSLFSRRKVKNSENALCKVCDRGSSPANNVVVFCDGCGDAYHQYCHHPPIDRDFIVQPDKEWLCNKCVKLKEGSLDLHGFVNATNLSTKERRRALDTLPKEKLVEVLMAVNAMHPDFAIFPSKEYLDGTLPNLEEDDRMAGKRPEEYYDGYETDPPSHYPRAGCGLARTLPPEQDDLPWLLDDNEEVFNRVTYSSEIHNKASAPLAELPIAVEGQIMKD